MSGRVYRVVLLGGLLVVAGCTLAEVDTTEPADLLVVEAVLRPDLSAQRIMLHPSLTSRSAGAGAEDSATIQVRTSAGVRAAFVQTSDRSLCVDDQSPATLACYVSRAEHGFWVRPGEEYELEVITRDGREAFARTRVPGPFRLLSPGIPSGLGCRLPPGTSLPLVWSRAEGAWAYIADLELTGLRGALAGRVPGEIPDTLSLTGIAVSASDTTMTLPRDFGLFQRTQIDQPLLIALREGLPEGVTAHLVIVAADRNYVNGVRGGSFNPSGQVRVPSVAGAATGVFGSVVSQSLLITVGATGSAPPCLDR